MSSAPISSIPDTLTAQDAPAASKASIRLVVDKMDASPSAKTYQVPADVFEQTIGVYPLYNKTGHGLTAGDEGKPLYGTAIYDNANTAHIVTGVLYDYIDADNFRYCQPNGSTWIPAALIESGYSMTTSPRMLYWDKATSKYVSVPPSAGVPTNKPTIQVCGYNAGLTSYYCMVFGYTPSADARVFPAPRNSSGAAWSSVTAYVVNDKVTYLSANWLAMQAGTNQTPALASYYWALEPQSGDVGKPLFRNFLLDDTSPYQTFTHVLTGILSTGTSGTIQVAPPGFEVTLSTSLLEDGNSYSIPLKGSFLFWDLSAAQYKATRPDDSDAASREILFIYSINATDSTFTARVL